MTKGTEKKTAILKTALQMASNLGLEGVTIGALAKEMKLSKSGLFAHFQAKEKLQLEILGYAANYFSMHVVIPALKTQRGIPRIKELIKNWIDWSSQLTGGCIFVIAGNEYNDRPGKVRDYLLHQQEEWIECLRRIALSAIKAGDFKKDIDTEQFAFDLHSMLLGVHYYDKLLNDKAINQRQEKALHDVLKKYVTQKALKALK